ncbi:MAG: phosphatidylglycerophosphatase A [Rickettsiales bacterium]|nr:phosphatidylglycerophosphatase A [Rickettsiales bacterium]
MTAKAPWFWIATWFGSGLSPKAPGTMGSLAALPFAYVIQTQWGNEALFLSALLVFLIGWWASMRYLRAFPEKTDPGAIVVDEVAAQWLLLAVLFPTWQSYLVGFILFRIFDIRKTWPVSWFDSNVKGALGVMIDDVVAALLPAIFLYIAAHEPWFAPVQYWLAGQ